MKKDHLIIASSTLFASILIALLFSNSPSGPPIIDNATKQSHLRNQKQQTTKIHHKKHPRQKTSSPSHTKKIILVIAVVACITWWIDEQNTKKRIAQHKEEEIRREEQEKISIQNYKQREEQARIQRKKQEKQEKQNLVNSLRVELEYLHSEEERKKVCKDIDQLMSYKKEEEDPFTFLNRLRSNNPNEHIGPMQALFGKKPSDQVGYILEHIRLNKYATKAQLLEAIEKYPDDNGTPYLHRCAEPAFNKLFAYLLDYYTDYCPDILGQLLQAKNNNGENILHHLLRHGNLAGLQKLYEKVKEEDLTNAANAQAEGSGDTPLHYLVQNRYLPIPEQTAIRKYFITYYKPTTDLCNKKGENYQATQKEVAYQILQDFVNSKKHNYYDKKKPCINIDLFHNKNSAINHSVTINGISYLFPQLEGPSYPLSEMGQAYENVIKFFGYFNLFSKEWEKDDLGILIEDRGTPFSKLIKEKKGNHCNFPRLLNGLQKLKGIDCPDIKLEVASVNKYGQLRICAYNRYRSIFSQDKNKTRTNILLYIAYLKLNEEPFPRPYFGCIYQPTKLAQQYFWHTGLGKSVATCPKEDDFFRGVIEQATLFIETVKNSGKDCSWLEDYCEDFVDGKRISEKFSYVPGKPFPFIAEDFKNWTQDDIEQILKQLKEKLKKIIENPSLRETKKYLEAFIQEYFGEKKQIYLLDKKELIAYQEQLNKLSAKEIASNEKEKKKFLFATYYEKHVFLIRTICSSYYEQSYDNGELSVWVILQAFPPPGHPKHNEEAYHLIKEIIASDNKNILEAFNKLSMPQYWVKENTKKTAPNIQHPAPSTQHPAPSTQHPAPSTQHSKSLYPIDEQDHEEKE